MQASGKNGTVSSMFTFWEGSVKNRAEWNEIDVEIVPSLKNPFSMNIIHKNAAHDVAKLEDFDPGTDWHVYQIEWTPEYIAWDLDGVEVRRVAGQPS